MSRIGKKPVPVPDTVKVTISDREVSVANGDKRLSMTHRPEVSVRFDSDAKQIIVERQDDTGVSKAMHGLTRALINNMVLGVTEGFSKQLEIVGAGWSCEVQGRTLVLKIGYANPRELEIPMGVHVVAKGMRISISGIDKQAVGEIAAKIRAQRKPEPYKGKGIKYVGEQIVRKQGKVFATGGA